MKNIYIFSNGELKREENTLCFETKDGKKFVPVSTVSTIYLFGEISINKKLLEFISENHITLHFFNYYGYYIGSYIPRAHYSSGLMILKQAEHYLDKEKRLALAKKFVYGGAANMIKTLKYYQDNNAGLKTNIDSIKEKSGLIEQAGTVESLMALEGNIREEYYASFNFIINNGAFKFEGRERRPPKGPLNALISFGNALMYTTVLGEIYKTHLDPRIGYLHSTNFRKFSLNLDVSEIFKPIIVDRVIFTLLNRGAMKESDFGQQLGGTYLNAAGKAEIVKQYNDKLNQSVTIGRRKFSYQMLIRLELYKIEKHIIGEKEYYPYLSPW